MENWLNLYPEYVNAGFGNKLLSNFLNHSSELEVYDALKRAGCSPDRDVAPRGKTGKNLDFKVRPDGRDILIEVTTPRMRLETESMYSDTPHAGFFDPSRGIEREGYAGPSRAQVVVESKVINQILEATSGTDYPVILIINYVYAYPEIMGFGEDVSGRISGIIHYRNGTSEFRPAPGCDLSEKEKRFFSRLMGPTRAERLPSFLGEVAERASLLPVVTAEHRAKMVCRRSYLPASAAAFSTHFPKLLYPLSDTQSYVEYNSEK